MLAFLHTMPWWMTLLLLPLVIVSAMVGLVLRACGVAAAAGLAILVVGWLGLRGLRKQRGPAPPVE